jgi:hypothetical protein
MSKQNAWIIKALWGKDPAAYIGKAITLSPVPDSSGFTEHGTRILFVGSPDIDNDLALTLPGGQALTFKKTIPNKTQVIEGNVDSVTGEVTGKATLSEVGQYAVARIDGASPAEALAAADDNADTPATEPQQAETSDAGLFAAPEASAPVAAPAAASDDDGPVPGRGPLVKTTDPVTDERKALFDNAWAKAINEGADEGALLGAVCDAIGKPTLENLTMGEASTALTYLRAQS